MVGILRYKGRIVWVAGTMQIAAVIEGFSRGFLIDRIASSRTILEFLPLNETSFYS